MQLAERTNKITPPNTSKMRNIANDLKAAGVNVINFAAGELDFDTSDIVKNAAIASIGCGQNKYTPTIGAQELRRSIAEHVTRNYGVGYVAEQVAVTAGAKQALFNAAMVLLNPGDEVIIPQPYWVTFPTQVEIAGGTPVFVDTKKHNYSLQAESVKAATTDSTKMIILNTPNNPTGVIYDQAELLEIAKFAHERGIWVVFDECYADLVRSAKQHHNIVSLYEPIKERTLIINSFSKSFALTGWRIGYICGPEKIIKAIANLQGHTTSNPSSIAQFAVYSALQQGNEDFISQVNEELDQRLKRAMAIVPTIEDVTCPNPDGAFYIFLDIGKKLGKHYQGQQITNVGMLSELLLSEARVAVVPGDAFGDPTAIRMSYAISTEDVVEGFTRVRDLLNQIQ